MMVKGNECYNGGTSPGVRPLTAADLWWFNAPNAKCPLFHLQLTLYNKLKLEYGQNLHKTQ